MSELKWNELHSLNKLIEHCMCIFVNLFFFIKMDIQYMWCEELGLYDTSMLEPNGAN